MRDKLTTFLSTIGAAAIALLLVPAVASADVINFDQVEPGGTITDLGGGDYLGDDIFFETITFDGTTVFCGVLDETTGFTDTKCLLNFDTTIGDFVLTAEAGLFDSDGNLIPGGAGPLVVLEGTLTNWLVFGGVSFIGVGFDTKHEALLAYFGLTATEWTFVNTEIFIGGFVNGVAQVTNADIDNTSVVPEPGLLALFGLGLVGAARRFSRWRV